MKKITFWIEAMRLRTLPVSLAGIIAACALALTSRCFSLTAAILCLLFATLAQIASNFANEYYDFKAGLDAPGRDGPRRGVTEGDISPRAMKAATYGVLAAACAVGLAIAATAGWWLVGAGIIIALGVIAYSAGPFPLSRHGLGEIAVIFFFGIIPVNLTYYVMSGVLWMPDVFMTSLSIGLMGANVLIVNNYRDADADRAVGKKIGSAAMEATAMDSLSDCAATAAVLAAALGAVYPAGLRRRSVSDTPPPCDPEGSGAQPSSGSHGNDHGTLLPWIPRFGILTIASEPTPAVHRYYSRQ